MRKQKSVYDLMFEEFCIAVSRSCCLAVLIGNKQHLRPWR